MYRLIEEKPMNAIPTHFSQSELGTDNFEIIMQDDFACLPVLGWPCELTLPLSPCLRRSYS